MLLRIVRMEFQPDKLQDFDQIFLESRDKIAAFPGCHHVEMCKDPALEHVRYTFSKWAGPEALEAYRRSELFRTTWARTKVLFSGKPNAYSLISEA